MTTKWTKQAHGHICMRRRRRSPPPDVRQGWPHRIARSPDAARLWPRDYLPNFELAASRASRETTTFEKTPDYMPNATAMRALRGVLPSAKLVFLLRNPTSRAYSAFHHHCRRGRFAKVRSPPQLRGRRRRRAPGRFVPPHSRLRPPPDDAPPPLKKASSSRPAPDASSSPAGRRVVVRFELESTPAEWAAAKRRGRVLQAPCTPRDFDRFVRHGSLDTRVVAWGHYAAQLRAIRRLGFADSQLYVAFSETGMRDAATRNALLADLAAWLGLATHDFAAHPVFLDALGREQLRRPGLAGALYELYMRFNFQMVRRHTVAPMLASTRLFLDDHFRAHNRDLDALLRSPDAAAIAVYPARGSRSRSSSTTPASPPQSPPQTSSLLPPSWSS